MPPKAAPAAAAASGRSRPCARFHLRRSDSTRTWPRSAAAPPSPAEVSGSVAAILADIRSAGDAAVARYARKFDGARLGPGEFRVGAREIAAASRGLAPERRRALRAVHAAVEEFNRKSLPAGWSSRNRHGALVGEKFDPIRRVGIYVPGGQVPLVSTVLMTATLARIAGCEEIAAFTPSGADGRVAPDLLAALDLAGVGEVYRVGGVQAIGAMAYGTASIPRWRSRQRPQGDSGGSSRLEGVVWLRRLFQVAPELASWYFLQALAHRETGQCRR